eukprot:scaffold5360_cov118-Isochrysis_galbana.AAC.10
MVKTHRPNSQLTVCMIQKPKSQTSKKNGESTPSCHACLNVALTIWIVTGVSTVGQLAHVAPRPLKLQRPEQRHRAEPVGAARADHLNGWATNPDCGGRVHGRRRAIRSQQRKDDDGCCGENEAQPGRSREEPKEDAIVGRLAPQLPQVQPLCNRCRRALVQGQ